LPAFLPLESAQMPPVVIGLGPEMEVAVSTLGGKQLGEAQLVLGQLVLDEVGLMGDPHAVAVAPPVELGTEVEVGERQSHEEAERWWVGQGALATELPPGFQVASNYNST